MERGSTLALVGPNGAGKTTLIRLLSGLLRPTSGELHVLGHPLPGRSDRVRARTAVLIGSGFLYDELTAAENLRFAARMMGHPDRKDAVRSALERVGLARVADRRARALSTGMRRRLALARLVLASPDLVLLDEPYAGLDEDGRALLDALVAELRSGVATIVVASHQVGEAVHLADRTVTLVDGRIAEDSAGERATFAGATAEAPPPAAPDVEEIHAASPAPAAAPLRRRVAAIAWKDLLTEARTKQSLGAMAFFAGLVLFIFSFALGPDTDLLRRTAPGLLWVGIAFTGLLSLSRTYQAEEASGGLEGLRAYAGDPRAIYLGKLVGNLVLLCAVEAVLVPAAGILFHLELWPHALPLAGIAFLGTLGFSLVGTLYAALAVHLRARELMIPLLVFPALVPVVLGAVNATSLLVLGDPLGNLGAWVRLLVAFDVIFLVVCTWIFPLVIEE